MQLNLPKNYNAKYLFSKLFYLNNVEDLAFQTSTIDVINSREDL